MSALVGSLNGFHRGQPAFGPQPIPNISKMYCAGKVPIGVQSPFLARRGTTASANEREIIMVGNKTFITLSLAAALGVLGVASATAESDRSDYGSTGGFVMPGSLVGVNPAYHPDIFGNAATAYAYGFVQSRDGTWHVRADWRGEAITAPGARALGFATGATKHRAEYDR
jgi:hypothetical protein